VPPTVVLPVNVLVPATERLPPSVIFPVEVSVFVEILPVFVMPFVVVPPVTRSVDACAPPLKVCIPVHTFAFAKLIPKVSVLGLISESIVFVSSGLTRIVAACTPAAS